MRLMLSVFFVMSVSLVTHATEVVETAVTAETNAVSSPAAAPVEKLKADSREESEIPLNLEKDKKATSEGSSLFRILFTLSILGLLGAGAYFFLRKYKVPRAMKHQTQIKDFATALSGT